MTAITFQGNPINTVGAMPQVSNNAPDFSVTKADLSELNLSDLQGKRVILNIFPSLDTETCATSVRKFNEQASRLDNTVIVCVSIDSPFASGRFCATENIENVVTGSVFRHPEFGQDYGVTISDGPLKGVLSRAIVIIDEQGNVVHTEHVAEMTDEPDYDAALSFVR